MQIMTALTLANAKYKTLTAVACLLLPFTANLDETQSAYTHNLPSIKVGVTKPIYTIWYQDFITSDFIYY